jgi:hypothetical protein
MLKKLFFNVSILFRNLPGNLVSKLELKSLQQEKKIDVKRFINKKKF